MDVDGAVVLVTGASSGIGAATARAASLAGARVVLLARREERIRRLAGELGEAVALAVPCDVTDRAQVEAAVRAAVEKFGRIDVLVNNAGQGLQATVDAIDPDDFRALLELNLLAPLVVMQAVLPAMREQGSGVVVNVSSGITWSTLPGSGAYAASKAALQKLSAIARAELADSGITVSLMFPSITETEFVGTVRGSVEDARRMEASSGLRPQSPEGVAEAILALIGSGAEQADLVPAEYGGTFKG
ncbi:short-chain dehydrogenase/reductase SDR [Streptomyces albus]|uniref:Short-chain dehydrogenase/reductase SDR n=1 Tax=Streptomyces albus (strain ATCC 21838 / DSM 41398 / FERM P-419 / JCM 4703 / NBRC 107858) TaxID=1081613 RepID=A0A0B5ERV4_STRA4|nr:short-chain dehydrogenase/reductase SDR [Streptomyces albus]AOU75811.1 short-chain dehydrogenase/reductase SDR [Streptomyces albus]AYN31615.1 short-chain dehydrogenase [Streptomyces albus]